MHTVEQTGKGEAMRSALGRTRSRRIGTIVVVGVAALGAAALGIGPALSAGRGPVPLVTKTFRLFPNPAFVACAGSNAKVSAKVTSGPLNDTLTLHLSGFNPGLNFDLFTVQNSNQNSDGSPVSGFTSFGLAWYQSDLHVGPSGNGTVSIKTILLNQIFGFDPAVGLGPTNTFHVGFWFNNPADAAACGFTGITPFNGEHDAGPLAFITRPSAKFDLGPLCTKPVSPGVCHP